MQLKERQKVLRRLQPGALRSLSTEVSCFLALSIFLMEETGRALQRLLLDLNRGAYRALMSGKYFANVLLLRRIDGNYRRPSMNECMHGAQSCFPYFIS